MGTAVARGFRALAVLLQRTGPYVLLELLLPGGTLLALLLFLYQRRQTTVCAAGVPRLGVVIARALERVRAFELVPNAVRLAPNTVRLVPAPARGCSCDGLAPLAMAPVRCSCSVRAC